LRPQFLQIGLILPILPYRKDLLWMLNPYIPGHNYRMPGNVCFLRAAMVTFGQ
jgi:hypothetical protein